MSWWAAIGIVALTMTLLIAMLLIVGSVMVYVLHMDE